MMLFKFFTIMGSPSNEEYNRHNPYEIDEQSDRKVEYANRHELEEEIIRRHTPCVDLPEEYEVIL